ncbi:MAG: M20/M25/M40 family metallo-hydrolase [Anaerolineaceae bacterium]|nr:M20/M25/M40 family metallo-hydrolase [Anaerolineaceae bacterium]
MQNTYEKSVELMLFEELLAIPSPSGREEELADFVSNRLSLWGYQPETDLSGNVIVRIEGKDPGGPLCCLAAHLDEIGLVVSRLDTCGIIRVKPSGGLLPWKIGERPVELLGDHRTVTGLLCMGSGHVTNSENKTLDWENVTLQTGLSEEDLEQAGIRPGTLIVPLRDGLGPVLMGPQDDALVAAWTFDDRMGVVALMRLLEIIKIQGIQPHNPMLIAFTVQEEIGGAGAMALAQFEKPDVFIAIDGCPIPPDVNLKLDGRPGIWSKDRRHQYDQKLLAFICECAKVAGTELQPVVFDAAASDASMVASVGGARRTACFGHVRENSHGYELARLSVFENVVKTLVQFVKDWQSE